MRFILCLSLIILHQSIIAQVVSWKVYPKDCEDVNLSTDFFTVATGERIIKWNSCEYRSYDPISENWQDFNNPRFGHIQALEDNSLLQADLNGYSRSTDFGSTWLDSEFEIPFVEGITDIRVKEDGVYITAFEKIYYSTDQGQSLELWEHPFGLWNNGYGLFSNNKIIVTGNGMSHYMGELIDHYFLYDYESGEAEILEKTYSLWTHLDVATTWDGSAVYILEYRDESKTELLFHTSLDGGLNFTEATLPFSLVFDWNIDLITDRNDNILIHNSKQIYISKDQGNSWTEITPTDIEIESIKKVTVSFDNYLYVKTKSQGVLRYECQLNLNICTGDIDADGDGYGSIYDCNDNDSGIYPGNTELCNGIDENCDGNIDEGLITRYFLDKDGDDYGVTAVFLETCQQQPVGYTILNGDCDDNNQNVNPTQDEVPYNGMDDDCNSATLDDDIDQDGFLLADDCDDNDPTNNPGAQELCNDRDDNCNGEVDEGLPLVTYFLDNDGDGYGNATNFIQACRQLSGYVINSGDCDDDNPDINPDAPELCDGLDNNCDGRNDEGLALVTYFLDNDGDGHGDASNTIQACRMLPGYVLSSGDCDDDNPDINPDAPELCDGVDNDCNGTVDNGFTLITFYQDADGDSYGDVNNPVYSCFQLMGTVLNADDCDDTNPSINPMAMEILNNDADENCDGLIEIRDLDGDGYNSDEDCNEMFDTVYPGAPELCDGLDNDCDGTVDEGLTVLTFYEDTDDDTYGDINKPVLSCELRPGIVMNADDCNDADPSINPSAVEIPNNTVDENCDGLIVIIDADGDGYNSDEDCDDMDAMVFPEATELCDGLDNDCNGWVDDGLNMTITHNDCFGQLFFDCNSDYRKDVKEWLASFEAVDVNGISYPAENDFDLSILDGQLDCNTYLVTFTPPFGCANFSFCAPEISISDIQGPEFVGSMTDIEFECDGLGNSTDINNFLDGGPLKDLFVDNCSEVAAIRHNYDGAPFENCEEEKIVNVQGIDGCGNTGNPVAFLFSMKESFVDNDGDGFSASDDCNDTDATVYPGAPEICDYLDNNCDGEVDEGLTLTTYFADTDGDGFGDSEFFDTNCLTTFAGFVLNPDDCDDTDPLINPEADEIPNNGIDEDCDGADLISANHEISNSIISIYPNPATNVININVSGQLEYYSSLYDLVGKLVIRTYNEESVNIEDVPTGSYLLEIRDKKSGEKIIEKIVIGR